MSEPLAAYQFQNCLVRRWTEDHLDTLWPDGTSTPAQFSYSAANLQLAIELGYGFYGTDGNLYVGEGGINRMHLEHELSHTICAEAMGLKWSPTLYHVAHRPFYPDWAEEESRVKAFQKFCNDGIITGELRGLDKTTDLKALCLKLKEIVAQLQLPQNNQPVGP